MITDAKIDYLQVEIKKAIADIAKKNNVHISFGNISYSSKEYRTKMTLRDLSEEQAPRKPISSFNSDSDLIGKYFFHLGCQWEIVQIKKTQSGKILKYGYIFRNKMGESRKGTLGFIQSKLG